jgi:hypothetical protein
VSELVTTFFPVSCLIEVVSSFFGWLRQTFTSRCPITHFVRRLVSHEKTRKCRLSQNADWNIRAEMGLDGGFKRRECREEMPVFAGSYGMAQVKAFW